MSTTVQKASFCFERYLISDAEIHVTDKEVSKKINLAFSPSGIIDNNTKTFKLTLQTEVSDENSSFKISVCAIGFFKYRASEIDEVMPFFSGNAPAILFPYIRAYLSSLSALSGIPLILLPTINMTGLADALKSNIEFAKYLDNVE